VATIDEVKQITREVNGPVSIAAGMPYNIRNFTIDDLKKCGVARVSLPTLLIFSSLGAIKKSLDFVNDDNMLKSNDFLYPVEGLDELMGR
jgi:2-methylisocitrate lyase-like PEP mutase family enzyme